MKKLLVFFLSLLVISFNFFIFVYGLSARFSAWKYYDSVKVRWLLNSALTLAIHDYEDTGRKPELSGENSLGRDTLYHNINEIDNDRIYVKLRVRHGNRDYTSDYVCKK
jgi:hypothetical protein